MVDFDRIGEVLTSRTEGIVPVRFFCSCRVLLIHVRATESALRSMWDGYHYNVALTCFALGISVDSSLAVPFLNSVLERHSLDDRVSFALEHPKASLRHLLDGSISTTSRKKYAEPILKGFSLRKYDIPDDVLRELLENCSDSIYQSPELHYRLVTNRHFDIATFLLQKTGQTAHTKSGLTLMHMLARDGDVTGLRWCIDNGYNIDIADFNGWSPLSYAVHGGHIGAIKFFLDKKVRTDIVDLAGSSLFHLACMGGSLEVVEILSTYFDELGVKANEMHCNNDGLNCLHISVKSGHWKLVEWCLENGFDPNQLDSNGLSPLHHAAFADSALSISVLHSGGASYPVSSTLESPLLVAVRSRRVDVLLKLVELYDLRSECRFAIQLAVTLGFSEIVEATLCQYKLTELWDKPEHVLSAAISSNNPLLVRMLLRLPDVDLNEQLLLQELALSLTREQWVIANELLCGYKLREFAMDKLVSLESSKLSLDSLVEVSVKSSYLWLLELTFDCGIKVDHQLPEAKKTLLICASERGFSVIVEMLLRRGANVKATAEDGRASMIYASWNGHSSCVELLLNHGADVNASRNGGFTSLMFASMHGQSSCVEHLLNHGADVNAIDNTGMTSLMYASDYGHSSCVELLLSHGADVNLSTVDGMTSLVLASRSGSSTCIELLLNHGADVTVSDEDEKTSIKYASDYCHSSCVDLLRIAIAKLESETS